MSLFNDLTKDMLASQSEGQVPIHHIFELLCDLIDLKFAKLEAAQNPTDKDPQKD